MKTNRLNKSAFKVLAISLVLVLVSCGLEKETKINSGEYGVQAQKNEKNIDMTQFAKAVLDIPYAGTDNVRQMLDIIYPRVGEAPYKVIVLFHGGDWAEGNKQSENMKSIFQATTQGYAIVSVNYRLSGEVTWPKPLYDAKAAIRFIRANGGKYLLDSTNIVVWGASSGGHIVEMLASTNNLPAYEDLTMGNPTSSSAVQGVVAWYAVADVSSLSETGTAFADKIMGYDVRKYKAKTHNANPLELVTRNFPPILLVHGTNDQVVPCKQSIDIQKKINAATAKNTAKLIIFKGASHGDGVIKTNKSVAIDLYFVDKILYSGHNPYRNTNYVDIRVLE